MAGLNDFYNVQGGGRGMDYGRFNPLYSKIIPPRLEKKKRKAGFPRLNLSGGGSFLDTFLRLASSVTNWGQANRESKYWRDREDKERRNRGDRRRGGFNPNQYGTPAGSTGGNRIGTYAGSTGRMQDEDDYV